MLRTEHFIGIWSRLSSVYATAAQFYMDIALLLIMSWLFKVNGNTMNFATGPTWTVCDIGVTFSSVAGLLMAGFSVAHERLSGRRKS